VRRTTAAAASFVPETLRGNGPRGDRGGRPGGGGARPPKPSAPPADNALAAAFARARGK